MSEYTPMSDTSTCLREALVERGLVRRRLHDMQEWSNQDEQKNRDLKRELAVTRSALTAIMETVARRDERIRTLEEADA